MAFANSLQIGCCCSTGGGPCAVSIRAGYPPCAWPDAFTGINIDANVFVTGPDGKPVALSGGRFSAVTGLYTFRFGGTLHYGIALGPGPNHPGFTLAPPQPQTIFIDCSKGGATLTFQWTLATWTAIICVPEVTIGDFACPQYPSSVTVGGELDFTEGGLAIPDDYCSVLTFTAPTASVHVVYTWGANRANGCNADPVTVEFDIPVNFCDGPQQTNNDILFDHP